MKILIDLILMPGGATAVFFGSLLTSAAVIIFALSPSAVYRTDPISQPNSSSPRLIQPPQLLRDSRSPSEIAARGLVSSEWAPKLLKRPVAVVEKPVYVEQK